MPNAIAVLNAGSSSLKFSVFEERGNEFELIVRGQAEGLYTAPRFVAKEGAGKVLNEKSWGDGVKLGHDGALEHLVAFLRAEFAEHRLVGIGHRVVHGGPDYARACPRGRDDPGGPRKVHSARAAAPAAQPGADQVAARTLAAAAAGGVLRHGVPQRRAAGVAGVRAAQGDHRPRRAAVRLSRALVRVHRRRAAAVRRARGARQDRGPPLRQRLQHVRDGGRTQRRQHDGLHGRGRPADGHALRQPRPRASCST